MVWQNSPDQRRLLPRVANDMSRNTRILRDYIQPLVHALGISVFLGVLIALVLQDQAATTAQGPNTPPYLVATLVFCIFGFICWLVNSVWLFNVSRRVKPEVQADDKDWVTLSEHPSAAFFTVLICLSFLCIAVTQREYAGENVAYFLFSLVAKTAWPSIIYPIGVMFFTQRRILSHPGWAIEPNPNDKNYRDWEALRTNLSAFYTFYPALFVLILYRSSDPNLVVYVGTSPWIIMLPSLFSLWPAFFLADRISQPKDQFRKNRDLSNRIATNNREHSTLSVIVLMLITPVCIYLLFADYTANPCSFHLLQATTWIAVGVFAIRQFRSFNSGGNNRI